MVSILHVYGVNEIPQLYNYPMVALSIIGHAASLIVLFKAKTMIF